MNSMKTAVWDTYVKRKDGSALHFDIIVPEGMNDLAKIFAYGADYLNSKNEQDAILDARQCRMCHVEAIKPEWESALKQDGYYILEMEDIPERLPDNPTRRQMILHLRAHVESCRFADFSGVNDDGLRAMLDGNNDSFKK